MNNKSFFFIQAIRILIILVLIFSVSGGMGNTANARGEDSKDITKFQGSSLFARANAVFSCSSVTEIPEAECDALVALYTSTNGASWIDNTGWLVTDTPCSWYGVGCDLGHVWSVSLNSRKPTWRCLIYWWRSGRFSGFPGISGNRELHQVNCYCK